jgi:peptide/nickel transport system ATP-binding protein
LLEVDHLSIRFRDYSAVRDLSFSIEAGEALGLVGESGSGKSISALAILRLLDGSARVEGSIRFAGRDLFALPAEEMRRYRGSKISMIFQEPMTALNPVMPIGRQIAEALEIHQPGLPRRQVRETVLEALRTVAIAEPERRARDYPHQFSGGQRQRIMIAMALVNRPELLIADEPTTALDVTVQAQILHLLKDLQQRFGLGMLFISHDLAVVAQVAARVAVMRRGLLLEMGTRDQVFLHPGHSYTKSLLDAAPSLKTSRLRPLATVAASNANGSISPMDGSPTDGSAMDGSPMGPSRLDGPLIEESPGHWVRARSQRGSDLPIA